MDASLTLLYLLTAAVCLAPLACYLTRVIKDPFHPLILIGTLIYFLTTHFPLFHESMVLSYLDPADLARFEWLVLFATLALYGGWFYSRKRNRQRPIPEHHHIEYNSDRLLLLATVLAIISTVSFYATYEDTTGSGYARELSYMWVPAAVLATQAILLERKHLLPGLIIIFIALSHPVDRFLFYGRGDTIRMAILTIPIFFLQKRPKIWNTLVVMVVLTIVISTLTSTRKMVQTGEAKNRFEALWKAGPSFFTEDPTHLTGGEEFIYGTMAMGDLQQTGPYYGRFTALTIAPLIHLLPHELTPWKLDSKYLAMMPNGHTWTEFRQEFGIQIQGGSAPTGFTDLFCDQWWFCLVTWFILGYAAHRFYVRALQRGNLKWQGLFVGFIMGMVYLITQEIYFSYLNIIFDMVPLLIAYRHARVVTIDESSNT